MVVTSEPAGLLIEAETGWPFKRSWMEFVVTCVAASCNSTVIEAFWLTWLPRGAVDLTKAPELSGGSGVVERAQLSMSWSGAVPGMMLVPPSV